MNSNIFIRATIMICVTALSFEIFPLMIHKAIRTSETPIKNVNSLA